MWNIVLIGKILASILFSIKRDEFRVWEVLVGTMEECFFTKYIILVNNEISIRFINICGRKQNNTFVITMSGNILLLTYIPFLKGLNLSRILLKSGRSSGFSAQHSFKHSLTKSKLVSRASRGGLKKMRFFMK